MNRFEEMNVAEQQEISGGGVVNPSLMPAGTYLVIKVATFIAQLFA